MLVKRYRGEYLWPHDAIRETNVHGKDYLTWCNWGISLRHGRANIQSRRRPRTVPAVSVVLDR